jgi:O-methyltransferase
MANFLLRKMARRIGLLDRARSIKRRFTGGPSVAEFRPADPRLLVSTLRCLQWLLEHRLAEGSDYLEFGIFRGFNLWYTQAASRALGVRDMRFFGFDSFFGIPPVEGVDKGGAFHEGDFSAYKDHVERWLTHYGADWSKTFLVEGFFDQSLTQKTREEYSLRRCSFCVVDCDLYSSTVPVLKFIEPLLGETSLLFFDDWADFGGDEAKGEPKAFAEFMSRNAAVFDAELFEDFLQIGGKGKAFVMRRRQGPAAPAQPELAAAGRC